MDNNSNSNKIIVLLSLILVLVIASSVGIIIYLLNENSKLNNNENIPQTNENNIQSNTNTNETNDNNVQTNTNTTVENNKLPEWATYLLNKNGYAIHIKNLHIFDEPKELSDYYSEYYVKGIGFTEVKLKKAPQNMCYCYNIANTKYALISIHPELLCKILNSECTIIVKKKILKEMIEKW